MTPQEKPEKNVFTLEHSLALKIFLGFGVVMFLFFVIRLTAADGPPLGGAGLSEYAEADEDKQ